MGELFVIDGHASRMLEPATHVGIRFADRGVTLIPGR